MTKLLGLTDASVVETPVTASDGSAVNADVVYVDNASGKRVILEVAVLSEEAEKRTHAAIRRLINEEGNSTTWASTSRAALCLAVCPPRGSTMPSG